MATRESSIGRGIERASENILRAAMARAQLDIDQQRVDLQARQIAQAERTSALERIIRFSPLLQPGTTIADNAFLHDDLKQVFPEFDPSNPGDLGGLVLRPETVDDVLRPMILNRARELDPGMIDRIVNNTLIGKAVTGEQLELEQSTVELQLDALQGLVTDPRAVENVGRRMFGLDQIVALNIGGRQVTFDSADAARLTVDIWKHMNLMDWERTRFNLGNQQQADIAKEFMDLMEEKGVGITRAQANRIISAVHSENPQEQVNALRSSAGWNEIQDAALQVYLSGARLGEETAASFLEQFPGLQNYIQLGGALEAVIGKDAVAEVLPTIARQVEKSGVNIATPGRVWGFNLGDPLPSEMTEAPPATPPVQQFDISRMDPNVVDTAIREVISSGEMTEQEVRQRYGDEVVNRATDPASVLGPSPTPTGPTRQIAPPSAFTHGGGAAPVPQRAASLSEAELRRNTAAQRRISQEITRISATLATLQTNRANADRRGSTEAVATYDRHIAAQQRKLEEKQAEMRQLTGATGAGTSW